MVDLAANRVHGSFRFHEPSAIDLVPLPFFPDVGTHDARDRLSGRAAAQQGLEIDFVEREQAVAKLALGGEADAVAAMAEWPRHRSDDADAAAAILVLEFGGWIACVEMLHGRQWSDVALDGFEDLV